MSSISSVMFLNWFQCMPYQLCWLSMKSNLFISFWPFLTISTSFYRISSQNLNFSKAKKSNSRSDPQASQGCPPPLEKTELAEPQPANRKLNRTNPTFSWGYFMILTLLSLLGKNLLILPRCPGVPWGTPGSPVYTRVAWGYPRDPNLSQENLGYPWEPHSRVTQGILGCPEVLTAPQRTPANPSVPQRTPGYPGEPRVSWG